MGINNLPLTNIEKWGISSRDVFNRYGVVYYKEECFFHINYTFSNNVSYNHTAHLYRINELTEGIQLQWKGNPFNIQSHI